MTTLKAGDLAYHDSFAGMVPVKIRSIETDGIIEYIVTATRMPYVKGEILTSRDIHKRIVPRSSVCRRNGQLRVRNSSEIFYHVG